MVGGVQLSENWGCRTGFLVVHFRRSVQIKSRVYLAPDLFFPRIS